MTKGYLYTRAESSSTQDLIALLKFLTRDWSLCPFRYQERLNAVELSIIHAPWGSSLEKDSSGLWPHGRAFCLEYELRWSRAESEGETERYLVKLGTESQMSLPEGEWNQEEFGVGKEYLTYLWGERKHGDSGWIEMRLPRALSYPIEGTERKTFAAARALDYQQNGIVRLTRLLDVEAVAMPKE